MPVQDTPTLLPVYRWGQLFGIDPLHLMGVVVNGLNTSETCATPIFQYPWQTAGRTSREEIADSIAQAERTVAETLGYWPAPTWIADERHATPRPLRPELYRRWFLGPRGQGVTTPLTWKYVRTGGQRAISAIELASGITYSDLDNDTYFETATVSVVTTVTDIGEIRIFYPGEGGVPSWEIRPITVTISGGTATITFRREQAVIPELLERINLETLTPAGSGEDIHSGVNGLTDANFLDEVDVYRVYNDPTESARLEWQGEPWPCSCGDCEICLVGYQSACVVPVNDPRDGFASLHPATYDADTAAWTAATLSACRDPDWVRVWYFSGWEWKEGAQSGYSPITRMDPFYEWVVARLAVTYMSRDICGCKNIQGLLNYWREDLGLITDSQNRQLGIRTLDSPWGLQRGAVEAWRRLQQRTLPIGEAVVY